VLQPANELRNANGTGHGRSGARPVDAALARLALGAALASAAYLLEVFDRHTASDPKPTPPEIG
jgi:hypothetical protein